MFFHFHVKVEAGVFNYGRFFFQYVNQITFVFTAVELIMMNKNVAGKYIILSYSLRVSQAHLFMSMIAP